VTGYWCCGDRTVRGSLLRLGEHPEVGVCFRCVPMLARRKREIERRTRAAPVGWRFRRRVLFRLGKEPLLMNIICAECGCRVDRGIIIERCEKHPACCCEDLPLREGEAGAVGAPPSEP
jgi:hypothetical protein